MYHQPRQTDSDVRFDPGLISRYALNGPRYTSYPTAAHFDRTIDEGIYREAVRRGNDDPIPTNLSLYVHLPFCASPCFYCACTRVITRDQEKASVYLRALHREIELQSALFDSDRVVEQFHLGGGTPTFFSHAQLAGLMDVLARHFSFQNGTEREFGIELDPRTISPAGLQGLAALGFNRVSMGVQDFDPAVQAAVNRIQSERDTLALMDAARAAGFRSINLDLIYGLPRQTANGFSRTLAIVVAARPDRIALYSYAHMPQNFKAQRQIWDEELPDPQLKLTLLQTAIETLTGSGYRYIGMDHFALPEDELAIAQVNGRLHRNFQGYSTYGGLDLLGLGMSAIGMHGQLYSQNQRGLRSYLTAVGAGRIPIERGIRLTEDDRMRAEIIQGLMCRGTADLVGICGAYGVDAEAALQPEFQRLAALAQDGLVRLEGGSLQVTSSGRLLVRAVAMVFDRWLQSGETGQYSRVI